MQTELKDLLLRAHSLENYRSMFDLKEENLELPILDCAGGLSSFNAEMYRLGKHVVSCDPSYNLDVDAMKQKGGSLFDHMLEQMTEVEDRFVWGQYKNLLDFQERRRKSLSLFLEDYKKGRAEKRYVQASLPYLPFENHQFKLVLCSYFLFVSSKLTQEFHVDSLLELCRVGGEVRVFPVLNSEGYISELLGPVMLLLQMKGYGVELREVKYHFQKNGNAMLRVWQNKCEVL